MDSRSLGIVELRSEGVSLIKSFEGDSGSPSRLPTFFIPPPQLFTRICRYQKLSVLISTGFKKKNSKLKISISLLRHLSGKSFYHNKDTEMA